MRNMKFEGVLGAGVVFFCSCGPAKAPEPPPAAAPVPTPTGSSEAVTVIAPSKAPAQPSNCLLRDPATCLPACDAGDAEACFRAGQGFHQLPEGQRDDKRASVAYRRGCDLGNFGACGNLGLQHENGWGIDRDVWKAAALYEKACAAELAVHCRNLGKLNEGVSGYPADPTKSKAAYERALTLALAQCDNGKPEGCVVAGYMYRDGKGTPVDKARGEELVQKACSMGYSWACKSR